MKSLKLFGVAVFVALNISGPESLARSSDTLFNIQVHSKSPGLADAKAEQVSEAAPQNSALEKDPTSEPENTTPADEKNEQKISERLGMQKI